MKRKKWQPSLFEIISYSLIYILSLIWEINQVIGFTFGILAWTSLMELLVLKKKTTLAKSCFLIPVVMLYLLYLRLGSTVNIYIALVLVIIAMVGAYFINFRRKEED